MIEKKTFHLVCNAHIDPVWLWQWQEGAAETIATFRTAAEICEENENFVFNHNEALLYKWIQEYAPDLFKRIQNLVKAGKWHIIGGWYLQPDCNMPSGESLLRQILVGKNYFKENFGIEPSTAVNFDSFGHTQGLVQILAKSGYDSYLFCRPDPAFMNLESENFIWIGYDGSEIVAKRFVDPLIYRSDFGKAKEKIVRHLDNEQNQYDCDLILWGVGNHGGGPSRIDVKNIDEIIKQRSDICIKHSTPENYFNQLYKNKDRLPRRSNDLNPWGIGCYTSMVRIKQMHRQLENELYMTEKMASSAAIHGLMEYPYEQMQQAICDLLTSEFHDILPGSSVQIVEEASLRQMAHGLEILDRIKGKAFFVLASGQPKAGDGEIPILVYNPHPFDVTQIIECEFSLVEIGGSNQFTQIEVVSESGQIPCQVEKELSNSHYDWRKRVVFSAQLKPNQMNRFDCRTKVISAKPGIDLKADDGNIVFKTKYLEVIINTKTGFIDRYRVNGVDCIGQNAFEPLVLQDSCDSWEMRAKSFPYVIGRFELMSDREGTWFSGIKKGVVDSVRIIEDGPIRSVIEVLLSFGRSFICQRYKLPKTGTEIEVEVLVQWNEKDHMLKLAVPSLIDDPQYLGQVAYGIAELPQDGTEVVAHKWVAVQSQNEDLVFTCVNDGVYGSDFSCEGGLRLTLLRSPAYASGPELAIPLIPQDRFTNRMDQGQRCFKLYLNAGKKSELMARIDRQALAQNEKPYALSYFPSGDGVKPLSLAVLEDDVVQITAIKRAQCDNGYVVRLFEPTGTKRKTVLSIPVIPKKINLTLEAFEIKSLYLNVVTGQYYEIDLLENKLK